MKNNYISIFSYLLYTLACLSCESNKNDHNFILYYSSGNVMAIGDTIAHCKYNGVLYRFYENGNVNYLLNYDTGKFDGKYYSFYENGYPKVTANFKRGVLVGAYYDFFETDSGRIQKKYLYGDFQCKGTLSSRKEFDVNGNVILDNSKVKIYCIKDTVKIDEKIDITFKLTKPYFHKCRIFIGNYDERFDLIDSLNYQMYSENGNSGTVSYTSNKKGKKIIRGYMEDYYIEKQINDSIYTTIGNIDNWFEFEYVVK